MNKQESEVYARGRRGIHAEQLYKTDDFSVPYCDIDDESSQGEMMEPCLYSTNISIQDTGLQSLRESRYPLLSSSFSSSFSCKNGDPKRGGFDSFYCTSVPVGSPRSLLKRGMLDRCQHLHGEQKHISDNMARSMQDHYRSETSRSLPLRSDNLFRSDSQINSNTMAKHISNGKNLLGVDPGLDDLIGIYPVQQKPACRATRSIPETKVLQDENPPQQRSMLSSMLG